MSKSEVQRPLACPYLPLPRHIAVTIDLDRIEVRRKPPAHDRSAVRSLNNISKPPSAVSWHSLRERQACFFRGMTVENERA